MQLKPATEILLSAAFVLTPREQWNHGLQGMDVRGQYVEPTSMLAVSWCALGALNASGHGAPALYEAQDLLCKAIKYPRMVESICSFNNTHTHAEVLEALYRAAELSESGELQPSRGSDE